MSNLNPVNNTLVEKIKELEKQVYALSATTQSQLYQWAPLAAAEFTYIDANTIQCAFDPSLKFQVTDKFRTKQLSGDYNYHYITRVIPEDRYIVIAGGDNYSITNADFDEVAYSRQAAPTGWPTPDQMVYDNLDVQGDPAVGTTNPINSITTARITFEGNGGVITLNYEVIVAGNPAANAMYYLYLELPQELRGMSNTVITTPNIGQAPGVGAGFASNPETALRLSTGSDANWVSCIARSFTSALSLSVTWPEYFAINTIPFDCLFNSNGSNTSAFGSFKFYITDN